MKRVRNVLRRVKSGSACVQSEARNLLVLHNLGNVSTLNRPEGRVENVMNEIEKEQHNAAYFEFEADKDSDDDRNGHNGAQDAESCDELKPQKHKHNSRSELEVCDSSFLVGLTIQQAQGQGASALCHTGLTSDEQETSRQTQVSNEETNIARSDGGMTSVQHLLVGDAAYESVRGEVFVHAAGNALTRENDCDGDKGYNDVGK